MNRYRNGWQTLRRLPAILLHPKYLPNIGRRRQGEHQTGEQNCGRRPLKLTVLSIVEVCSPQFCKEKHRQNQVDGGEYHLVDHGFNLAGGVVPRSFDCPSHIAVCRKRSCAEQQAYHENERERQCDFFVSFHKIHLSEMRNKAAGSLPPPCSFSVL